MKKKSMGIEGKGGISSKHLQHHYVRGRAEALRAKDITLQSLSVKVSGSEQLMCHTVMIVG